MKKTLYKGKTSPKIKELRKSSELVHEQSGRACYLMYEICQKDEVTLKFSYWFNPNTENEDHMTELTAFGSKDKISKIEKELSQPLCTEDKYSGKQAFKEDKIFLPGHHAP